MNAKPDAESKTKAYIVRTLPFGPMTLKELRYFIKDFDEENFPDFLTVILKHGYQDRLEVWIEGRPV